MAIFDDLLTSSRGPGVIGTALGLFVLLGFGVLFLMVTDERFMGWRKDPAAEVREMEKEVTSLHGRIEAAKSERDQQDKLARLADEFKSLRIQLDALQPRINEMRATREQAEKAIQQVGDDRVAYLERYRAAERGRAKGEKHERLELTDGTVYAPAEVLKVDAVGMQVRHSDGVKRIDWRLLPADMQDRFQFDASEMQQARQQEGGAQSQLHLAAGITDLQQQIASREARIADNTAKERELTEHLAALQQQQASIPQQLASKHAELQAEASKRLRNTDRIRRQINSLEQEQQSLPGKLAAAQADLAKRREESARMRGEIAQLQAQIAKLRQQAEGQPQPADAAAPAPAE